VKMADLNKSNVSSHSNMQFNNTRRSIDSNMNQSTRNKRGVTQEALTNHFLGFGTLTS